MYIIYFIFQIDPSIGEELYTDCNYLQIAATCSYNKDTYIPANMKQ